MFIGARCCDACMCVRVSATVTRVCVRCCDACVCPLPSRLSVAVGAASGGCDRGECGQPRPGPRLPRQSARRARHGCHADRRAHDEGAALSPTRGDRRGTRQRHRRGV